MLIKNTSKLISINLHTKIIGFATEKVLYFIQNLLYSNLTFSYTKIA